MYAFNSYKSARIITLEVKSCTSALRDLIRSLCNLTNHLSSWYLCLCAEARAAAAAEAEASSAQQAADELTWWHGYFMRAGRLGAIRRVKPSEAKVRRQGNQFDSL